MREFFKILGRFLPPYRMNLVMTVIFTITATVSGLFSFYMMKPILEILFGISSVVLDKQPVSFESVKAFTTSVENNFYYFISNLVKTNGEGRALAIIGFILIFFTLLKTGLTYLSSYTLIPLRAGIARDIRLLVYKKILDLPIGFFTEQRKGDIMSRMSSDVQEVENSIFSSITIVFKNLIIIAVY